MAEKTGKRRRPSAKETRARMTRAVSAESPMSRAGEEPKEAETALVEGGPQTEDPVGPVGKSGEESRGGERTSVAAPASAFSERRKVNKRRDDAGGRPVRLSVDVSKDEHRALRILAAQSGTTGMAVMRALLQEALEEPELAERVRDRLDRVGEAS